MTIRPPRASVRAVGNFDPDQSANPALYFDARSETADRERAMTDTVRNQATNTPEAARAQNLAVQPAKKSGMSTTDMLVWGAVILGLVAVVVYQVYFCPTCYTGGARVVG